MSATETANVCPVEKAGALDHSLRRLLQNPEKILHPYIKPGMTVLDVGCGPGYFSLAMSTLVGKEGNVIAADLQQGMLDIIDQKISARDGNRNIRLHLCKNDSIAVTEKVDFTLCFYMVHEVPDRTNLLNEISSILNPGGTLFIAEPKFHVNQKAFRELLTEIEKAGFSIWEQPKVFFSRAVVCTKK